MDLNDALDMVGRYNATAVTFEMDSMIIVRAVKDNAQICRNWGVVVNGVLIF
jgi:hypothetical protein